MKRTINSLLRQYGTEVGLIRDGVERKERCFFQPVNTVSWQSILGDVSPLGLIGGGQYTYVGSADVDVQPGDILTLGARSYLVRRAEPYYYGDQPVYIWARCVEKGGEDTWGSQS